MRHEWTEENDDIPPVHWAVDSERGLLADGKPETYRECDCWPAEILRLAARVRELEAEHPSMRLDSMLRGILEKRISGLEADCLDLSETDDRNRARIAALEEENRRLRNALEHLVFKDQTGNVYTSTLECQEVSHLVSPDLLPAAAE